MLRRDSIGWLSVLAPGAIAVAAFWSTLDGGFLSDDFLIGTLWDESTGSTAWSSVFADFGRSWFGVDAPLYRPLLTLSFGVDLAMHGADPFGYHVTNLALHAIATVATAATAFVLGNRNGHGPAAALACGTFVALHPVAVESVAWIAARNSGLEVAFRSVALACFTIGLRAPSRAWSLATWAFAACALASKESAVVLVPCALAIDVLYDPATRWRDRVGRHAPLIALLAAYFALRIALFGEPLGSPGDSASDRGTLAIAVEKLGAVWWPGTAGLATPWFGALGLGIAYACALLGALRPRHFAHAIAALATIPLLMLPTHSLELHAELGGSRLLLGAVHAAGFVLAATVFANGPRIRFWGSIALAAAALSFVEPSTQRVGRFERAWECSRAVLRDLGAAGEARADDRPIALLFVNNTPPGTPPLNPNAWFPLAARPFQDADHPLVSLGFTGVVEVPGSSLLTGDPSAARELWHEGVTIWFWDDAVAGLRALPARRGDIATDLTRDGEEWAFGTPRHPFEIESITGVAAGATGGSVTLLPALEANRTRVPFDAAPGPDGRWSADVTHLGAAILLQGLGATFRGVSIELEGTGAAATSVAVHNRVPSIDVPRTDGAVCSLRELAARLGPQAGRRVVLLAPQGALVLPTDPESGAVRVPADVEHLLGAVMALSRTKSVWFFVEADPRRADTPRARSRLDRFVVR